jgi:hypothetical protein
MTRNRPRRSAAVIAAVQGAEACSGPPRYSSADIQRRAIQFVPRRLGIGEGVALCMPDCSEFLFQLALSDI